MDFKKFAIWVVFVLAIADLIIFYQPICNWLIKIATFDRIISLSTLIITALAFFFARQAFVKQSESLNHQIQASKTQQEHNEKALKKQDDALLTQQTLGAWQIIGRKASGNSGKIEAIEFLAGQGKSLRGIDMSTEKHGGQVYLCGLNVSQPTLAEVDDFQWANFEEANLHAANFEGVNLCEANFKSTFLVEANFKDGFLLGANFQGSDLWYANFERSNLMKANFKDVSLRKINFHGACLQGTSFEGANLQETDFEGADLWLAIFKGAELTNTSFKNTKRFDESIFGKNFISDISIHHPNNFMDEDFLKKNFIDIEICPPKSPTESKFQFDFVFNDDETKKFEPEIDKDGEKTGRKKYFIHLVPKNLKNKID